MIDWKTIAIDRLRSYEARRAALKNIPIEIARMELAARGIRSASADGKPVHGGGSGREDWILSNLVYREELKRNLRQARDEVRFVDGGLECLNQEERRFLERFYICPERGAAEKFCDELGIEKAQVYRKKDMALKHFTLALYGRTES